MWSSSARRMFPAPPAVPDDSEKRKQLRKESTEALIDAIHQAPEVRRISSEMRGSRIRNGYPDLIEGAFFPR